MKGNNTFEFATVPLIHFEWAGANRIGELLGEKFRQRNALIVTDAGLVRAGVTGRVESNLRQHGFKVMVFDEIVADPPESVLRKCVDAARLADVDIIIGCGGGSSLDIAKLVAVMLGSSQQFESMIGIGKVEEERLPLVLIPTTAGTGSEVTNISIVTIGESIKAGVVARQLFCDYVLLDAELTVGLPRVQTAATGIDAMVHAIEAYTGRHKKNPISDALAREALRLLSQNLIAACKTGTDKVARENMLLGAMLAGQAFTNSPVAAVHALAYPLGGHYHIAHGLSNALMLAPVLRFNAKAAAPLYAELCDILVGPGPGDVEKRSQMFVNAMIDLIKESGVPLKLREAGVKEESLPMLAKDAMKQTRLLINNPVELAEADALSLYREAF